MNRLNLAVVLGCIIFTGGFPQVWGQEDVMEYRKGTIKYPDEPTENVKYKTKAVDGHTQLVGLVYFEEPFNFEAIKVQKEETTFMFTDDNSLLPCILKKQEDLSYLGTCSYPESEKKIEMKVFSPKPTEEEQINNGVGIAKGTGEGEG